MTVVDGGWPGQPVPTVHREWFEPADPAAAGGSLPLVLLHEGLGSISAWGPFPQLLADAADRRLLAYDRPGYGQSELRPGPWPAEFMHYEAAELAHLLRSEGVEEVILVGHSDGATIALLYPSQTGDDAPVVAGIASLSAHVMVEELNVASIEELRRTYRETLAPRLARHHRDADETFENWSDVWASERFRPWTIYDELTEVRCPVLVVQGESDGYGTWIQVQKLTTYLSGPYETAGLAGVDHWPHREATDNVLRLITDFADSVDPRQR